MWQKAKNIYHLVVAISATVYYGFPARKLTVIAVTGTDGKTTTVNLIYHILKTAGKEVSMISTVGAKIDGEFSPVGFHVTNPGSIALQKFLKMCLSKKNLNKKDNFLVLEMTSHGLDQYRVWGIPITLGLITNITNEHLDYHKTYENYVKTKVKLLNMAKIKLFNRDDISYKFIKQHMCHTANNGGYTFGLKNQSDFMPSMISAKLTGMSYNLFTRYNMLAAISACSLIASVNDKDIEKAIEKLRHLWAVKILYIKKCSV